LLLNIPELDNLTWTYQIFEFISSGAMGPSRYELVDSLYGPGTIGAWLLTLCAVLISWTVNTSSRRKDTISMDFIAMLLLPIVAASHLIVQIMQLPTSVVETITSQDFEMQKHAFALEAPLNICETFSFVALVAAVCCGPWWNSGPKWKRLCLVVVIGLMSWATENIMFAMATMRGVHIRDANLTRPYLFLVIPTVAITWGFLVLCVAVGGIVWVFIGVDTRGQSNAKDIERSTLAIRMITQVTLFYLPAAFVLSTVGLSTSKTNYHTQTEGRIFLIPRSDSSMSSLDQILALTGGILVLLVAIHSAYCSRVAKGHNLERISQRRRSI